MLKELRKELGDLNEINFALQLMRASKLTDQEGSVLETKILGLYTYFTSLDVDLHNREYEFKRLKINERDENGKKYPANRIEIEWEASEDGQRRHKVKSQIKIVEEQLKTLRNYNYHLRSEKKL